jgi:two-component system, NarL family, nitrate/nitrite response regulator NarL
MVVSEGGTADDVVSAVKKGKPDVLLLDIAVPGDGIGAAKNVVQLRPATKVVILTASSSEADVGEALRIGVQGYILKDIDGPGLVSAIELVHRGEPYVTPALASRLLMQNRDRLLSAQSTDDSGNLTPRDTLILGCLAKGLTNREIARSLSVNVRTIKHYLTQVFRKMRVRNRVEAILEAQKMKLQLDGHAPGALGRLASTSRPTPPQGRVP